MKIHDARIVSIAAAPCALSDEYGNLTCGFALVEFEIEYGDGERVTKRDICPFDSYGWIGGLPDDGAYAAQALGDDRPTGRVDPVFTEEEYLARCRNGGGVPPAWRTP